MLQKQLQKRVKQLKPQGFLAQLLRKTIKKVSGFDSTRLQIEGMQRACNQLLSGAQTTDLSQNQQQIRQLLEIVKQILLNIHFGEIYEVYLIKIRLFLLKIALNRVSPPEKWDSKNKIMFLIKKIEQSDFYVLIQEDFYSNLESLYIEAIKINLKSGNPQEALKLVKQTFQTLKKQIVIISDFANLNYSNKISYVLEKKKNSLQILFYLQFGSKVSNTFCKDELDSQNFYEKTAQALIPKYQKLFNKIVMNFDHTDLIRKTINNLKSLNEQEAKVELFKDEGQKVESFSVLSQSFTQFSSSKLESSKTLYNVQNSIKFIEQLEKYKKQSSQCELQKKITNLPPQRISIQCKSDHTIQEESCKEPTKSRFSNLVPLIKSSEKKAKQKELRFSNEMENMIFQIRTDSKNSKFEKQYRPRKFSMVAKDEQRERERLKKIKINPKQTDGKQSMKVSQEQMLKSGIFLGMFQ